MRSPGRCWTASASTTPPSRPPGGPAAPGDPQPRPSGPVHRLGQDLAAAAAAAHRHPVAREYHLDYIARLAGANHLEFSELTAALDDTAAITLHSPRGWKQHEQERLAAAASPDRPAVLARPPRLPARPRRVPPDAAPGLP